MTQSAILASLIDEPTERDRGGLLAGLGQDKTSDQAREIADHLDEQKRQAKPEQANTFSNWDFNC